MNEELMSQEADNVLVHMSTDEVKSFSRAQGGVDINPELSIPQFTKLGQMIDRSDIRNAVKLAIKGYVNSSDKEQHVLSQEMENIADHTLGDDQSIEYDVNNEPPEAQALGFEGTRDDTEIAIMPTNLLYFFWENLPKNMREINPTTGFPQFGLGDFLGSLLGGVAGFFIGGPIGAAAGASLGSLGGGYVDERDLPEEKKTSFLGKLGHAALAGGLGYLGGQSLPGMLGGGAAAGASGAAASGGHLASSGTAGSGGLWSSIKDIAPYALMGAGALHDSYNQSNYMNQHMSSQEKYREDQMKAQEEYRKRIGFGSPLWRGRNYEDINKPTTLYGKRGMYKKGGEVIENMDPIHTSTYIEGHHPGQKDNIHVDVPKGSRVLDADTVSSLGDGNSAAGVEKLYEFIKQFKSESIEDPMMVPCALSSGEFVITPDIVQAIGKGDLAKGHDLLENFVKKLRAHKKHSVNDIPKESKPISYYLGKNYSHIAKRSA